MKMDENGNETGQTFVGVKKSEGGALDYSLALQVLTKEQADKRIKALRFQQAIQDAEKVGLGENRLRTMVQTFTLADNDKPIHRGSILAPEGKKLGISKEKVLSLVRNYKKEKARLSEKGELYHYHQTSLGGFKSAAEMRGLMAYDQLAFLGKLPEGRSGSIGARSDVVQMTRDVYDN